MKTTRILATVVLGGVLVLGDLASLVWLHDVGAIWAAPAALPLVAGWQTKLLLDMLWQ